MTRITLLSLASLSLLAAFPPTVAAAQSSTDVSSSEVVYRDLDLNTDKGAAKLYVRIVHAAQELCATAQSPADIAAPTRFRSCVQDATARAVQQVNSDKLSELYARKSGTPAAEVETASAR
jgi:UrcA family protein